MPDSFSHFTIDKNSSLKEALLQMTSTHRGVLLVVDSANNLIGVLADGDVRRALLDDVSLDIPVTQIINLNPKVASTQEDARKLLSSNPYLIIVPVVNSDGKVTGVYSALNGHSYYENPALSALKNDNVDIPEGQSVKYLAVIPARGGSKRIPGKNLAKIGQETLVSHAIIAGIESKKVDHVMVSTDSEEIAAEAKRHGIEVPWLRPSDLSGDRAKTVDVLAHALQKFEEEKGYRPTYVVLLEPTAPLRSGDLIDQAASLIEQNPGADSLMSVTKIRHIFHPEELLKESEGYLKPYLKNRTFGSRKLRDEQGQLYIPSGLVYITKSDVLANQNSIYGKNVLKFETDETLFADIDEPEDLEFARIKYQKLRN